MMMIDIHSHILPAVDDGSQSFEESIEMLKMAFRSGVKHQILTPHVQSSVTKVKPEAYQPIFDELKKQVLLEGIDIELYLGCELHYRSHVEPDYDKYSLNHSKYVLIEFSFSRYAPIEDIIFDISRSGYFPVVAHVERYEYLKYEDFKRIKDAGGILQVNTHSILGLNEKVQRKTILKMLEDRLIDIVASDTHNTTSRKPNMNEAYHYLEKLIDQDYLEDIFYNNALKIIQK